MEFLANKSKKPLNIAIKHKKILHNLHSKNYIDFMNTIKDRKTITIIHPDVNLYDLIQQSRSVIGFPFTSPSIIAKEMNVPVIYYSRNHLMASYKIFHGVKVVQDLRGLKLFLEKLWS